MIGNPTRRSSRDSLEGSVHVGGMAETDHKFWAAHGRRKLLFRAAIAAFIAAAAFTILNAPLSASLSFVGLSAGVYVAVWLGTLLYCRDEEDGGVLSLSLLLMFVALAGFITQIFAIFMAGHPWLMLLMLSATVFAVVAMVLRIQSYNMLDPLLFDLQHPTRAPRSGAATLPPGSAPVRRMFAGNVVPFPRNWGTTLEEMRSIPGASEAIDATPFREWADLVTKRERLRRIIGTVHDLGDDTSAVRLDALQAETKDMESQLDECRDRVSRHLTDVLLDLGRS